MLERGHTGRTDSGLAFGRITKVYPEERMVEVKTFMGMDGRDDQHISKCQWISLDGNPQGDVSGAVPRVNSYCLVFWVDGMPFVFGHSTPTDQLLRLPI
jgi:hypothetical protein